MDSLRLLVADDDKAVRGTIAEMSRSLGHEVVAEATDGTEAVEMAHLNTPDLLLLDIRMPGMSGLEAAQAILERTLVPIVIITAHTDNDFIRRAAEIGAFSYLVKPVTCERLSAAIATAQARFADLQLLRGEVGDLKYALEGRKLIERAKGIVMRDLGVDEQEAYRWLKRTSSRSNRKVAEVARRIVALEAQPQR